MKERVLITGIMGCIGKIISPALADEYDVCGLDKLAGTVPLVDISDLEQLRKLFAREKPFQFLIHLAADSDTNASWELVLKNNIIGTRNVYACAKEFGVRRVVFASSNHVTGAYEGFPPSLHTQDNPPIITVRDPIRPDSYYGASKAWGEALARQFYELHGIESICLRIGSVLEDDDPTRNERTMKTWLSHRDLIQLIRLSLKTTMGFGIYYGVSANDGGVWDISEVTEELGFKTVDNAALLKK